MKLTDRIYLVGSGGQGFNLTDDYDCHIYLLDGVDQGQFLAAIVMILGTGR